MSPFGVLFREFFGQFFASESVTSDIRLRQAVIAVIAFLVTPGLLLSIEVYPAFEFARFRAPDRILPMTRLLASLFLTFSTVSIGLIAAFVWDSLSFDRRDAMVLGPLPVSRGTIVGAKLAAMAALLAGTSLSINILTAIPFAMVANGPTDGAVRHLLAHIVATSYAALFVFSAIVILRALLGMLARGHVAAALGSLLQFAFASGLLCFLVLAPTATSIVSRRRGAGPTVRLAEFPAWMPSHYFLAMYEQLRGTANGEMVATGQWTAVATFALAACAVVLTIAAYHRQFQFALSPAASAGTIGGARLSRALAGAMAGSSRLARATSDFILITIARNRAQQAPIAINAAIGLALVVVAVVPRQGDFALRLLAPGTVLAIPLMLACWTCIGLRASFFAPSELPASWTFRANAPTATDAYALGTRAAIVAFVGPPALLAALGTGAWIGGWAGAMRHAAFVVLLLAGLADFIALTVDHLPFTRAYRPGHAKLKTRWPLYMFGAFGFSYGLASLELLAWNDFQASVILLVCAAAVVAVFEWAVRRAGRAWHMDVGDDVDEGPFSATVLDLGNAFRMEERPVLR